MTDENNKVINATIHDLNIDIDKAIFFNKENTGKNNIQNILEKMRENISHLNDALKKEGY